MALTKEDLQAIQGLLEPINTRLAALETGQVSINDRLEIMQTDMEVMQTNMEVMQTNMEAMQTNIEVMQDKVEAVHMSQVTFEGVHVPKIQAALDGYAALSEKNKENELKIIDLVTRADRTDLEMASLKRAARG